MTLPPPTSYIWGQGNDQQHEKSHNERQHETLKEESHCQALSERTLQIKS